jgi:ubiquinone/menaquinone biosynthesis C-methylase UbiE
MGNKKTKAVFKKDKNLFTCKKCLLHCYVIYINRKSIFYFNDDWFNRELLRAIGFEKTYDGYYIQHLSEGHNHFDFYIFNMTLDDAKKLIATQKINKLVAQKWADLGCGSGLFSKALLSMLNSQSAIYGIDKQPVVFSDPRINFLSMDFEKEELTLPLLNGIMMANSFHYVKSKLQVLQKLKKHLLPDGVFLVVEYDTEIPNRWVPYPISFSSAKSLFAQAGFGSIEKINERQSVYNSSKMYAAFIYNLA